MGYAEDVVPEGENSLELGNGQRTSMQLFQQIYRDVTGKSEKLTKFYELNFHATWQDLESLYQRLEHMLEQYNVLERSCTVTISYTDDSHERFSSFERAQAFEAGSLNVVESVTIEYRFLIVLPIAKKPQPYKLVVTLSSREGMKEKARRHAGFEGDLLSIMFASRTGMAAIEYVDYAVARTFRTEVDKWFEGLDGTKTSAVLLWLKRYSHHIPWMFKYATAALSCLIFLRQNFAIQDYQSLLSIGLISFSSVFILSGVADRMGHICERAIDQSQPLSYLDLTRGDKKLVAQHRRSKALLIFKSAAGFLVAVAANVAAAAIAHLVGTPL